MTAGLVFAYCGYLTFSALTNGNPAKCTRSPQAQEPTWILVVGFIITLLSVIYGTFRRAAPTPWRLGLVAGYHVLMRVLTVLRSASTDQRALVYKGGSDENDLPYRPDIFHGVYALASMTMGMVLTNWSPLGTSAQLSIDQGVIALWVKIASSWATAALYIWTVIAPALFPDRDFS